MKTIESKINAEREFFNTLGNIYPADKTIKVSPEVIGGVSCHWFTPAEASTENIIIYLHGGSYMMGSIKSHKALVSHVSSKLKTKMLFVDYSLAPEHPFPHGQNDVIKVYQQIRQRYPGKRILFIGDSAGGGLAVSSISYLAENGIQAPDGIILISPWIDLDSKGRSYETRKHLDPILDLEAMKQYASYYRPEKGNAENPAQLKFSHFPPAFIMVGSNEVLFDDAQQFYDKVKAVQEKTEFKEYKDQTHVWLLASVSSPGAVEALNDMTAFLRTHFK